MESRIGTERIFEICKRMRNREVFSVSGYMIPFGKTGNKVQVF
ncbi:hypothetical protein LEP1GSC161_0911 [Leptospira santarosai str. CBC1416]|uniref:Uncharacterized protein n=4 Tax=Leptospira santarosai TaxID=28183 RepID=M6UKV9_9LEPT|nr:hypothetical protein LEP1GSC179_2684 [Leptospira santarosai str. MOR084]EKO78891.1 hypothetical protein LEP1GSC068_1871 [Leptospira sp. Fiocruz LV3954]EKR91836.1 hypothetical protein LEP1GSC163_2807 [Leptospira santarosai str. CBC379]EKS08577.1 hypothetical protein LEP1GSC071_3524 [Leptospira santarosai str. JET]EMF88846.1 hypothetical protein LEP1GSC005_1754 [Leptospira santarosai str. ST188]EMI65836.1 hypothetical protein LEP1GSC076_0030 [Leptospira sp. Fiocruz LV4135]EMJ47222.1 hypothet